MRGVAASMRGVRCKGALACLIYCHVSVLCKQNVSCLPMCNPATVLKVHSLVMGALGDCKHELGVEAWGWGQGGVGGSWGPWGQWARWRCRRCLRKLRRSGTSEQQGGTSHVCHVHISYARLHHAHSLSNPHHIDCCCLHFEWGI